MTSTTSGPTSWSSASASGPRPAALDALCETVFARGLVTDVIIIVLPKAPTAIHLDMIFSQVDRELCVVYPPSFLGPERLPVLHRRKGEDGVRERPDFFTAARELGLSLGADPGGRRQPHTAGPRAVELGLQLPGGTAGDDRELSPQRVHPL